MELNTAPRISLDFEWINYGEWEPIFMELLAESSATPDDLAVLAFPFDTVWACFFYVDDHVGWVELVNVEVEEVEVETEVEV